MCNLFTAARSLAVYVQGVAWAVRNLIWCLHPVPVGSGAAVRVRPLPMVLACALVGVLDLALYLAEPDLTVPGWLACRPAAWLWTCLVITGLLGEPGHRHWTCSALLVWVLWDWAPSLWGLCPYLPGVTVGSWVTLPCGAAHSCQSLQLLQLLLYNCFAPQKLKPKEHHGIREVQTWQNQKICKVKKGYSFWREWLGECFTSINWLGLCYFHLKKGNMDNLIILHFVEKGVFVSLSCD